jgi:hypothetical protein
VEITIREHQDRDLEACKLPWQELTQYLSIKPVARNVEAIQHFHRAGFSLLAHIDMFLDLTEESNQEWKNGITIHGHAFRY